MATAYTHPKRINTERGNALDIIDMYVNQRLSTFQIGQIVGMSYHGVRQLLKRNDVPRRVLTDACVGKSGELHPNWKGGCSRARMEMNTTEYKTWRLEVFKRDNFTCQDCHIHGVYFHAHHIKPWIDYPEFRYVVSNGVTLCKQCHYLKHRKQNIHEEH